MLPKYTTHRFFYDYVKPNSRVLDIGCSAGIIGKELKNKGCYVIGIDINQTVEDDVYDLFIQADIETSEFNNYKPFDYILMGDVLEHLNHPDKVLQKAKRWLNPDGSIIISVPNVANWRIRIDLLCGNFNYTESGIMNKTHKKFFTKKTIVDLIESTGFDIELFDITSDLLPARFWCKVGKFTPLFAHQFIIVAKKNI